MSSDPYFSNVVFLCSFDGTDGSTIATDESSAAHGSGTFAGGITLSNLHSPFGTSSLRGNGAGSVWWADSADWAFGSDPFTIEFWQYVVGGFGGSSYFSMGQWDHSGNQHSWLLWNNPSFRFQSATSGSDNDFTMSYAGGTTDAWKHFAVDSDGTNFRLYYDGVKRDKVAVRTLNDATSRLAFAGDSANSFNVPNTYFIAEARITKGVARYQTDTSFTVPTEAFPRSGNPVGSFSVTYNVGLSVNLTGA